ncbi:MAG: hypothetical protein MUP55_02120 [Candidatus Aenigmarchaeota archaeon]|nr:hypothetical protein [Candidatus Aenigmarchaeota archaeon]
MKEKKLERTTILIDKALWTEFRIAAMREKKSASQLLNEMIKEKVKSKDKLKDVD